MNAVRRFLASEPYELGIRLHGGDGPRGRTPPEPLSVSDLYGV